MCSPTQEYKKKYEVMNYKVICHNGIQKNNDVLKKYKNECSKCDILLYSPTIEAGVNYEKNILILVWGICLTIQQVRERLVKCFIE